MPDRLSRPSDASACGRAQSSRRAQGTQQRLSREGGLERALVQILVVVANVQVRTLRTVVEKGFALMAIGRKLVGPKESGKLHSKRRDRGRRSGSVSAEQRGRL